jgi:hypothetical protein
MTSRLWTAAVAALLLTMSPLTSSAAVYTVTPVFVQAFTADGAFDPIPGYDLFSGIPAVLQYDFLVSADGFAPNQYGFANGVFTISMGGNLSNTLAPGWNQSFPTVVDTNGAAPGGLAPLLRDNMDLAAQDLKDILIGVAFPLTTNPAIDPRFQFGRGPFANYNVGTTYIDYAGGPASLTAEFTQASALYRDGATNRYIGLVDPLFGVYYVPEPTAAMLAVLGMIGAVQSRRARGDESLVRNAIE